MGLCYTSSQPIMTCGTGEGVRDLYFTVGTQTPPDESSGTGTKAVPQKEKGETGITSPQYQPPYQHRPFIVQKQ